MRSWRGTAARRMITCGAGKRFLPTEKAQSLKMQVDAIKHQGSPSLGEDADKRSTEIVGARNGMNYKHFNIDLEQFSLGMDIVTFAA